MTARRAWLEARRKGCGASDVAAILGRSPYGSPWSVWAEKVGLVPIADDLDEDDIRTFGLDMEPYIAERFERRTGLAVVDRQQMVHHPQEPWCFATLDGVVVDRNRRGRTRLGVFESKYTADPPWETVPDHYRIAGLWQMYVTRLPHLWMTTLHLPFGRPKVRIYELEQDVDELADIVATVTQFWVDHVVTGQPPPADGHPATSEAMRLAYGRAVTVPAPTIDVTDQRELVDQLAKLRKEKAAVESLEETAANRVKALIAQRGKTDDGVLSDATIDGELVVSWRSQPDTRLDTDAVRADHGTKYDKTGTKRILRLHGKRNP